MKAVRIFSSVALLALCASFAMAQDTPPAGGAPGGAGRGGRGGMQFNMVDMLKNRIKSLNLSADDQAKVDAIIKEYEPKVTEAQKALTAATTEMRAKIVDALPADAKEKFNAPRTGRGGRGGNRGGGGGATPPAAKPEA